MTTHVPSSPAYFNHNVDYVIHYGFGADDPSEATEQLKQLLQKLGEVGLQTEVRQGDESSLLVFVRASKKSLSRALHRSRVRDWLYGVRNTEPEPADVVQAQTEAERLRVINHMIIIPSEEGGAGITPKLGKWKNVLSVFPLHDIEANRRIMGEWSKKTFLSTDDLDHIRNTFGESIGFYFAFLQSYFRFLLFPAIFGFACWLLLGSFSIVYSVINCLWGVIFIEYWKRQELDLSCRWQTKGVSAVRPRRPEFKPEREVRDKSTNELIGVFPARKRIVRQILQVPFMLFSAAALGIIIATCFAIEIFISEVYNGPLKTYLVFIPTILLSSLVPTMSAVLVSIATRLNDYENYETQYAHDMALTRKIFTINFITSYLPIFLTAFVYIPLAGRIVPYLDVFDLTVRPFVSKEEVTSCSDFTVDQMRLKNQVIYFTVTEQIINFGTEAVLPFLKQHIFRKYKSFSQGRAARGSFSGTSPKQSSALFDDAAEETEFLTRVRNAIELPEYSVTDDLREMCIQFGYLSLFSSTWPLVPVSFLVNNWVELRSDLFKICVECKRPSPQRSDTIGPWLDSLGFLSWAGSITSASLVYLFSNGHPDLDHEPSVIKGWVLLLSIFFSEHIYLIVRYAVRATMANFEPPNSRRESAERFLLRKRYLDSAIFEGSDEGEEQGKPLLEVADASFAPSEGEIKSPAIWTTSLSERFWSRQSGWSESAKVGALIIENRANRASKKQQ